MRGESIESWSLTSLRDRLIKTGARLVRHVIFQMAEAALPRSILADMLDLINGLLRSPVLPMPA